MESRQQDPSDCRRPPPHPPSSRRTSWPETHRGRRSSPNGGAFAPARGEASAVDVRRVGETSGATWLERGLHGDRRSARVNLPLRLLVFNPHGGK